MDINEEICNRIDELLQKKGLTSYEATMRANLSENAIYYWRSNTSSPNIVSLVSLLDVLGVKLGEFFVGIENYDLTDEQKNMLQCFDCFLPEEQQAIIEFFKIIAKRLRRKK